MKMRSSTPSPSAFRTFAVWFMLVALAVAVLWWWLQRPTADLQPPATAPVVIPPAPAVASSMPPPSEHPIDGVRERVSGSAAPADASAPIADQLLALVGRQTALRMLQLEDFPRRFVATVDSLGREAAPAQLWPVNPTGGRLAVLERDGRIVIDPDNGLRYAPFVQLVEAVDLRQAVAVYLRIYPQLQRAYEEIGFDGRHFNTRLVQVVDLLLATPASERPLEVVLPDVRGPIRPSRPWVLYEFADPELRRLTAGQQWLLRMGPVNQRRLQARLRELRALLASGR